MALKLKYRRILLKLSGEALGLSGQGINPRKLESVVREVRNLRRLGVELALVIGGGNIWRKRSQDRGMDPVTADYLGMLATVMNALALQQALQRFGVKTQVQSAVAFDLPMVEVLNPAKARAALKRGQVVIFAGGTGKPFFTTDTAAAQRAAEVKADGIIKASPIDGVYSSDPTKNRKATKYMTLTMREALARKLEVMDRDAFRICAKHKIPIVVCKWGKGNVVRVVQGKRVGTLVTP